MTAGTGTSWRKLTPEEVREIRRSEAVYADLARRYGVTRYTIACIKTEKTYKDVSEKDEEGFFGGV